MLTKPHIAIIGAGPIGLEAALYARLKGYDVTVFERTAVGGNIRDWRHVRMFSPFGLNASPWGRDALSANGVELPQYDAILKGQEYIEQYLEPLSQLDELNGHCLWRTPVQRVTRQYSRKTERVGDQGRAKEPFRLLIQHIDRHREEEAILADVVLDCSGTYGNHNWVGAGGAPCPGELHSGSEVRYGIPDAMSTDFDRRWNEQEQVHRAATEPVEGSADPRPAPIGNYVGERTLVVGAGHSAATTVTSLEPLHELDDRTRIFWVTRNAGEAPLRRFAEDRLPERDELAAAANELTISSPAVEWLGGHVVREIVWNGDDHKACVMLESVEDGAVRSEPVDRIIANVGYRPDRSLYEELQIHECYATQGPMKLAVKLLGETSADCLDQTSHGAEVLRNPEPNFYILGMKSYGRNSNFLIQVGLQQIVDVFSLIERDWEV